MLNKRQRKTDRASGGSLRFHPLYASPLSAISPDSPLRFRKLERQSAFGVRDLKDRVAAVRVIERQLIDLVVRSIALIPTLFDCHPVIAAVRHDIFETRTDRQIKSHTLLGIIGLPYKLRVVPIRVRGRRKVTICHIAEPWSLSISADRIACHNNAHGVSLAVLFCMDKAFRPGCAPRESRRQPSHSSSHPVIQPICSSA